MVNGNMSGLDGPRSARAEETEKIIELANLVFRPAKRGGDMAREFPVLLAPENAENLYIVRDGTRVVSLVGVHRQTIITSGVQIAAACIGSVCTDPEYRGRGLASALMDLAIARAREVGDVLMPISGNRTLYRSRGATPIGPTIEHRVPLDSNTLRPKGFSVREYRPADWPALRALQSAELPRWDWDDHETPRLLQSYLDFGGTCLLAEDGTGALAAGLLFCSGSPLFATASGCGRVVQFIGRAEAIPALLADARQRAKLKALTWAVLQAAQPAVATSLSALGTTCTPRGSGWTLLIPHLPRLLDVLAPIAARSGLSLDAKDRSLTLATAEQSVCVRAPARQVELLFAGPACWDETLSALPAPLRIACAGTLPVPLCDYGINFV